MSNSRSVKQAASTVSNARHAKALVDRLRGKVNGFTVQDNQRGVIGKVKDLVLESAASEGNFNLAVDCFTDAGMRTFLINSMLLQKIDIPNHTFFTKLSPEEVDRLPEHRALDTSESRELSERSPTTAPTTETALQAATSSETLSETLQELSLVGSSRTQTERSPGEFNPFPPESLQDALETPAADLPLGDVPNEIKPNEIKPNEIESFDVELPAIEFEPAVDQVVRTLEEKLVLNRGRRKAGEIIVRKEVETRLVEVPVRYERLIVEQIGTEHRQLASIDLGKGEVIGVEFADSSDSTYLPRVKGEFATPVAASQVLDTIAKTLHHRCKQVNIEILLGGWDVQRTYHEFPSPRLASQMLEAIAKALHHRCNQVNVELLVENSQIQKTYQEWFERFQKQNQP